MTEKGQRALAVFGQDQEDELVKCCYHQSQFQSETCLVPMLFGDSQEPFLYRETLMSKGYTALGLVISRKSGL